MLVIGHRGAPAREQENSLASFRLALAEGADGIECDVRLTADGDLVISHDEEVARGRISELPSSELKLPLLHEVLELRAPLLVAELKVTVRDDSLVSAVSVARAVTPLVDGVAGVVVSSFDPAAVAEIRALAPAVVTALTVLPSAPLDWVVDAASRAGHAECHIAQKRVEPGFVEHAHEAGLRVLVFTVNDSERARALRDMGVDGVFTDDPALIVASLSTQ